MQCLIMWFDLWIDMLHNMYTGKYMGLKQGIKQIFRASPHLGRLTLLFITAIVLDEFEEKSIRECSSITSATPLCVRIVSP